MTSDKQEKLRKLKVLAERGSPGERDNAKMLFEKLCNKYHIFPDEIETSDEIKRRWFKYRDGPFKKLLHQCIYKATGGGYTLYRRGRGKGKYTNEVGVDCTAAMAIEIELDYSFFSAHLEKEIERLYHMFIQKNSIFPPNCKEKTSEESHLTSEDIAMYSALKKHNRDNQIGDGK